jgi:acetyltransferase-like isoleucine patch superfamily enzyme
MRKISLPQILVFFTLLTPVIVLSVAIGYLFSFLIPDSDMRGIIIFLFWSFVFYLCVILVFRLFLSHWPMIEGPLDEGSRGEFIYHVYLLFSLLFFQPLIRSLLVPVPLMRLLYLGMGAKMGENTYSGGSILDPPLVRIGSNTIIGHDAVLFSHVMEGKDLALASIEIGDNVTIGAKAVIMPGVHIGNNAIVAVNSVVKKGTKIGDGERWAGTPAKRI